MDGYLVTIEGGKKVVVESVVESYEVVGARLVSYRYYVVRNEKE